MRLREVSELLFSAYGPQGWWPLLKRGRICYSPAFSRRAMKPRERFEIAVGAIMAQSTAWTNVEKAMQTLGEKHLLSPERLAETSLPRLARFIRSSGYHTQKARKLRIFSRFALSGAPWTRERLLGLWGIGPETADSILLYGLREPRFVVDAYARRILQRLGLLAGTESYETLQQLFQQELPADPALFNEFHALLVRLGKEVCRPEPLCGRCPLQASCSTGQKRKRGL